MSKTKIDWATDVWNPVTGCTPAGAGCANCYANGIAKRFWGERKFSDVKCHEGRLTQPLHWRKPRTIFVNSMGDLFHKDVPFEFVDKVLSIIWLTKRHRYIALTKRPERMREYFAGLADGTAQERLFAHKHYFEGYHGWHLGYRKSTPIQNLIIGVSCSNQAEVDRDIPILLATPAACRCVSLEPLLGPVDLSRYLGCDHGACGDYGLAKCDHPNCQSRHLRWVIVGGESGRNARPMHPYWVRTVRDQCKAAGTAFYFKQWGEWNGEVSRVGKSRAGHLLDGREHREVPEVRK